MPNPDDLAELRAEVADMRKQVDTILRGVTLLARHLGAVAGKSGAAPATDRVAGDAELNGKHGDPKVICDPRDWSGESYKGGRMSEAPPDFLDLLAVMLDGFADTETDPKKQKYKRDDAAKARGWSRRLRAQPATPATEDV